MNVEELIAHCRKTYYDDFIDTDLYLEKKREAIRYIKSKDPTPIANIAEIGVLCGLGGRVLMQESGAKQYHGWDNESYYKGNPTKEAHVLLSDPAWKFTIHILDTQGMNYLGQHRKMEFKGNNAFDLVHVDGDHHPVACAHDMVLAHKGLRDGGWILVDDYVNQMIQEAVAHWMWKYEKYIIQTHHIEGATGNYLIQVKTYKETDGKW